jgi:hypothetical protein
MPPKKPPAKKKESKNPENGGEMVNSLFSSSSCDLLRILK